MKIWSHFVRDTFSMQFSMQKNWGTTAVTAPFFFFVLLCGDGDQNR